MPLETVKSAEGATDDDDDDDDDDDGTGGLVLFDETVVWNVAIDISNASWSALTNEPREYAEATFMLEGKPYEVAIRLKGNTQFRELDDKPSLVIDFNRVIKDQEMDGLASVYLHNMTYDATMMLEYLTYRYFRSVGVPASRTAYARLTINDMDYGLYLFVEKQNKVYKKRYWEDTSGSVYESGSFNRGCDVDDVWGSACDCFEVDDIGPNHPDAIEDMCDSVGRYDSEWFERASTYFDMPVFVQAQAAEMVISHWDNYGWNGNNFRLYHEPTEDTWHFTPWSTDLAFGWNPWGWPASCGDYGTQLQDFREGFMIDTCWDDTACREVLDAALDNAVAVFAADDIPAQIDAAYAMISAEVTTDGRRWYSNGDFETQVDCIRQWAANRPTAVQQQQ